jgi:16S rRNA processing protein RimM
MTVPAHVIVGRVRRAHGIRGELVVEALTDDAEAQFAVGRRLLVGTITGELLPPDAPGPRAVTVRRATPFKGGWIVRFTEIPDRTAAELWRDRYLLVPGAEVALPASGEVFYHDLIGMRVERIDGRDVGRVVALYEVPQGVLIEVETPRGLAMLPYHPPMVVHADLARSTLIVDPPPGLLDDGDTGDEPIE